MIDILTYIFQHYFGHLIIAIAILLSAIAIQKQISGYFTHLEKLLSQNPHATLETPNPQAKPAEIKTPKTPQKHSSLIDKLKEKAETHHHKEPATLPFASNHKEEQTT